MHTVFQRLLVCLESPDTSLPTQTSLTYLARELVIHRRIQHPHVIAFRKALLTETHIAIVLEYAAGDESFLPSSQGTKATRCVSIMC